MEKIVPIVNKTLIVSPFERPDVGLALATLQSGAFPILHLGRIKTEAIIALNDLSAKTTMPYGVCIASDILSDITLPAGATTIIAPWGTRLPASDAATTLYQVHSLEEALLAKESGARSIIVKGNEGAGKVGGESTYILLQQVIKALPDTTVYIQGGVGIHTAAAALGLGAAGVILDSQVILFPECSAPKYIKAVCEKLNGSETRVIDHYRVLLRPNSPAIAEQPSFPELEPLLQGWDLEQGLLPLGQDIALSIDLVNRYKKLSRLVFAMEEAASGHLQQAKALNVLSPGNSMAQSLHIEYPIAQGPMTRVSDVPGFAQAVAQAGALPFVALSLLKGKAAQELIRQTKQLAGERTWGVGMLGFAPQELRDEQLEYIKADPPPVVLIAGGRPSQAKPLEKMGIKVFLHVPSASLLDMFLKEGARNFVFEGRECGGHVGPLSSMVLWEKQIERLLQEEAAESISVFFAGGIHDAFSAAFIAVMAASLAAKGVKVGVLMGTAYIYTEEAVATGAIVPQFQEQAIAQKSTVLLETAPGHETRCLHSPFVPFFNGEKDKLQAAGVAKKEIWEQLEGLNVGRLRIAAKGIERQEDVLLPVDAVTQWDKGMYMIGQVAAMQHKVVSLSDLHKNVAVDNYPLITAAKPDPLPERKTKALDVAIVGMACIYPGAQNIEEYWRNILLGKDSVTEVPDERWNKEIYFNPDSDARDMSHSKWGGFIPTIDFDPLAFGIPPQSLAAIEPSQLLSLLVARQALEHAGYQDGRFNAENVSVIIGAEGGNDLANSYGFRCLFKQVFGEMPQEVDDALPKLTEDSFPGVLANVISGRITNRLNLGGRNYTVDAACASSIAAIDLACQELFLHKSDMVLAGGVDLHNGINDYLMFSSTHALSRKGRCATFDAEADGIALGEGVAIVVLKRLEDARRDNDTIYAVIKGIGGSSDGKSLGLTAPRKNGQMAALENAYEQAGISPASLGLLEAHGTGTVVGDKTELSALTDLLLHSGALVGQTHLGSVKTQIGHTKCAAGLAGLIKAALSVYHGVKPATLHLNQPNAYYNAKTSPFVFNKQAGIWNEAKRRAGVSAFGFGGTNFHAVLENEPQSKTLYNTLPTWPSELFVFRGKDMESAQQRMQQVQQLLQFNNNIPLKDIAWSLAVESREPIQVSIVTGEAGILLALIGDALAGKKAKGIFYRQPVTGKVAFLFSGQGSQRIHMARELFVAFPAMQQLLQGRKDYEKVLFPDAVFDEEALKQQKETIKDTRRAQPLLGIVNLAIAEYLRYLGIHPDMVAGHSYGELPALCFAGAFERELLIPLSERRAAAILEAIGEDKGMMVAVNAPLSGLGPLLEKVSGIWAVNFNSPRQTVLAGCTEDMMSFMEQMKAAKISFKPLEVACAFHSPLLSRAKDLYSTALEDITFKETTIPVWSNTTAAAYPSDAHKIAEYLSAHLVEPVRFTEEIENMYAVGARVFIETGPGKVLSDLTRSILGKEELILSTEEKGQEGIGTLLQTLARYIASGREIQLEKLFEGRNVAMLDLDHPEKYKRNPAVWLVNGHNAVPATGKLPAHGALPITQPIALARTTVAETKSSDVADQMMLEYLHNMKMMIQAQRDVMLGYLGHTPQVVQDKPFTQHQPISPVVGNEAKRYIEPAVPAMRSTQPVGDIKPLLLQIVSDKTGYPNEMLGLEMDLEADLSIDSIKRMEIIGELRIQLGGFNDSGDEESMMEQLAAIKTLNGLINWISDHNTSLTVAATVNHHPVQASIDLKSLLLQVVSDKTGYPVDMLGMDLDLEADLSIDSIKRMEIIGELQVKIGWSDASDDTGDMMEQLTAIKTLNNLVNWLREALPHIATPIEEAQKIIDEGLPRHHKRDGHPISRMRFELARATLNQPDSTLLAGKRFAITDDRDQLALALKALLESKGATADIVTVPDELESYDGLFILNRYHAPAQYSIMDAFGMVKKLNPERVRWIYIFSDVMAHIERSADVGTLRDIQGFPGFIKSLDREMEHTLCRMVSVQSIMEDNDLATLLVNELLHSDKASEVIYQGAERYLYNLVAAELAREQQAPALALDKEAVVLVLGGAQGITAELVSRFSKDYPCRYILIGRSPHPDSGASNPYAGFTTKEALRQQLVKEGNFKTPAALEKQVQQCFKDNQIRQAIASLENNGATVTYHSLDLRDEQALSRFIHELYRQYHRIDGVIHGAGLLEDKLFAHKTPESFERVFATKVNPLRVLVEELREEVQFVMLFSSIASVYGNRGQTDYAAANSVMDRYTWALKKKMKGRVVTINWGPWKGAGMVSASLEQEYDKRGIAMIPLEEGAACFVDELKYGTESQVLIMAGNTW